MASSADGSVVIKADFNVSDANKKLEKLKEKITKTERDINAAAKDLNEAESKRDSSATSLEKEKATLKEMQDSREKAAAAEAKLAPLTEKISKLEADLLENEKERLRISQQINSTPEAISAIEERLSAIDPEQIEELRKTLYSLKGVRAELAAEGEVDPELDNRIAQISRAVELYDEELEKLGLLNSSQEALKGTLSELESEQLKMQSSLEELRKEEEQIWSTAPEDIASEESIKNQQELIKKLQSEWNTASKEAEKYGKKLSDLKGSLEYMLDDAGDLQMQINEEDRIREETIRNAAVADQHIVDINKELLSLKERQKKLSGYGIGTGHVEYDQNETRISEITRELNDYRKALTAAGQAAGKMESILRKMSSALGNSNSEVLRNIGSVAGAVAPRVGVALAAASKMMQVAGKAGKALSDSLKHVLKSLGKAAKAVLSFSRSAVKAFSRATMGVVKMLAKLNIFPKMFSTIGKSFQHLGRTVKSALFFAVIYKGLSMVREEMGLYLSVNSQFNTSLRRLQGVLLTAFQPIYEVIVPALNTLVNALSRAIATVTQFFASLFGTTAKQAQANAKSLYEQAHATKEAGKAADEAAGSLAAFDEINTINTENKKSGGGTEEDTGPLFDWEYEDTVFDSWGEAFSAFLDKLLAGIPKLKDAFKKFADWFNNQNQKFYDMFKFPGVLDKVKRLGRELAGALNGLVDQINWNLWGRSLGAGLNLGLNFLTSFLYAFDWINLGRKLADFVNGLADEIDWYEFGRLLWSGFKIAIETLAGFLLGLDMPLMAQAASNIVIGFFTEMKNTINRIPWYKIGRQIADFLANLDWYGMLSSIASAIAAGLMAAVSAVRGFLNRIVPELERIAGDIVRAFKEFFQDKVKWAELAMAIGDGIAAALHFVASLLDPELFYEIGNAIGTFFINLQWVEIFGGLAEVLANGINSAVAAVKGFLNAVGPHLREIAEGIAQKINEFVDSVNWGELGRTLADGINMAVDFLLTLLGTINWKSIWDSAITFINEAISQADWESVGKLFGEVLKLKIEKVTEFLSKIDWAGIVRAIVNFLCGVDWIGLASDITKALFEMIGAAVEGVLALIIDLPKILLIGAEIVAGILKGIVEALIGLPMWLKEHLVDPIVNGVKDLFGIHSPSTVFAEIGVDLIGGLLKGISDTWGKVTNFFTTTLPNLKKQLSDTWEDVKKTAKEKFSDVKDSIIEKLEGLKNHDWKSVGSSIVNSLKKGISNAWGKVTNLGGNAANWVSKTFKNATSGKARASAIRNSINPSPSAAAYSVPDISNFNIPALARGAVIPPNREFMAVLGDQKNGTNVEAPAELIKDMVIQALRETGGMAGVRTLEIPVNLDGRTLTRVVVRNINDMTRANGKPVLDF